jgi:tRNA nucleotidyltransferase/poly(A) polymerase
MKDDLLLMQLLLLLNQHSPKTYLVGGCVRDMLLGKTPKDFDIVTTANIPVLHEGKDRFSGNGWSVDYVGQHFGVYIFSKDGRQFDVANFRKDIGGDGRRPESTLIGTLEEDALRRDFTVNSIYYEPFSGQYIDPNGGIKDVKAKILRFIGKPHDRIKEDYLRVFRFYRFLAKLGFEGHPKSLKACREMFNEAYKATTPERVRMEIERIVL